MALDLKQSDFVPNKDRRSIRKVSFAVQLAEEKQLDDKGLVINAKLRDGSGNALLTNDRIAGVADGLSGKRPDGRWIIDISLGNPLGGGTPSTDAALAKAMKEQVRDLWLIIEYQASIHYNK